MKHPQESPEDGTEPKLDFQGLNQTARAEILGRRSNMNNQMRNGIAIAIGFLIPFLITYAPSLGGTSSQISGAVSLLPASTSQQTYLQARTYLDDVPVGQSIPTSLELASLYQNYTTLHYSIGLSVAGSISSGSNVTFKVTPNFSINSSLLTSLTLHAFLVGPSELVVATWPVGDALAQANFGSNVVGFKTTSYSYQSELVYNELEANTLSFTFPIPKTGSSVGTWQVFVFLVKEPIPQSGTVIAAGANSFNVPQPSNESPTLSTAYGLLQFFGAWTLIAGVVRYSFKHYPEHWLANNWPIVLGISLLVIYLLLRFVVS